MPRPNLLFIYTDEQRADTMAAYGNRKIQTPSLDRLAETSTVFERAYVTQPVCTPSRASLLTGLYPHTNGCVRNNVPLSLDVPTIAEMLPVGEYATCHIGKWHLGDEMFPQHGFQEWAATEDAYRPFYREGRDRTMPCHYSRFLAENGFQPAPDGFFNRNAAALMPEEFSKPAFEAREASRFIRENRDRPFCLFVNFLEPHMPFFGPRDGQYDPGEIDLPANFDCPPDETTLLRNRLMMWQFAMTGMDGRPLKTERDWRELIARYWGMCSHVDTYAGAILRTLEECGVDDNTIVVYTSDHGDMMGSHRMLTKCVMYEEASRVPLLVRLPGQTEARRVQGPVSQVDLVPTLLEAMGVPVPDSLEGTSLAASLRDGSEPGRDAVIEWNGVNNPSKHEKQLRAVPEEMRDKVTLEDVQAAEADPLRTISTPEGWKLTLSPLLGQHELYNLNEDPLETRNLAPDPGKRPLMRDLRARMVEWQKATSDKVTLPEV